MTIPTTPFRKDHTLTGIVAPLVYDWQIEDKSHLLVTLVDTDQTPNVETPLAVDTNYTVSNVGNPAGGNVTPILPYTAGWKIVITSNVPFEQTTDFTNQNSVKPEEVESMADKLSRQIKQIVEQLTRTVKTTVGGGVSPDDLIESITDAVAATTANVVSSGSNASAAAASASAAQAAAVGINWKKARAATTGTLPACTYSNGVAGVGATLTGNANGALAAQDGVTLIANDRLVVKDQAAQLQNGVYVVTQVGTGGTPFILTRADDANSWAELTSQVIIMEEGSTLSELAYICTINTGGVIGTNNVVFAKFNPPLEDGAVSTAAKIVDGIITYTKLASGIIATASQTISGAANTIVSAENLKSAAPNMLLQVVSSRNTTKTDSTSIIPIDDTIPQVTEGVQLLSAAITPKSTTSKLLITVSLEMTGGGTNAAAAVFVNGAANAVAASAVYPQGSSAASHLLILYEYVPGTTSAQTITVRFGPATAGTVTVNGVSGGGRFLGGSCGAVLRIEEISQ